MAKISNPEKECKSAPEQFSGTSKIVSVEKKDFTRGVILDSLEEFAQAIIVYNGGSVPGARATQNNLTDAIFEQHGGLGAGLMLLAGAKNADGFTKRLVQEAVSSLKSGGRFHRDFDYDAMGTNFFKTTVEGHKIGNKYILELCAAYVGTEPEGKLAEKLQKPMALIGSSARGRLSIVDDWWFNLNLEDALSKLPISKKQMKEAKEWAKYFASGGYDGKPPEFEFKHDGKKFALTVGLDAEQYLRPENGKYGSEYMQARGSSIVGGAWTIYDETGNNKVAPRIKQPSIVLSASMPGERYSRPSGVTPEEMSAMQNARDYLATLLPVSK